VKQRVSWPRRRLHATCHRLAPQNTAEFARSPCVPARDRAIPATDPWHFASEERWCHNAALRILRSDAHVTSCNALTRGPVLRSPPIATTITNAPRTCSRRDHESATFTRTGDCFDEWHCVCPKRPSFMTRVLSELASLPLASYAHFIT
jgi:hypothetical protein